MLLCLGKEGFNSGPCLQLPSRLGRPTVAAARNDVAVCGFPRFGSIPRTNNWDVEGPEDLPKDCLLGTQARIGIFFWTTDSRQISHKNCSSWQGWAGGDRDTSAPRGLGTALHGLRLRISTADWSVGIPNNHHPSRPSMLIRFHEQHERNPLAIV